MIQLMIDEKYRHNLFDFLSQLSDICSDLTSFG